MVQFKDIFLGTETRDYKRAANSQKCMRVAGKHNDLEDVGQDDTHHTFFEMLGNWSFGDYYKKEAIEWAWELLTEVWKLPKDRFYATVFKDEKGEIPTDEEAAEAWKQQPGLDHDHILYYGRKDNFWEMAETGPCGPNSEVQFDLGPEHGEIEYLEDGSIDLDNGRFVELWNLVFIQFNRTGPKTLDPLPEKHVDTGLGLDRLVALLQNTNSNYRTDLFSPIIDTIQKLSKHTDKQVEDNFTPYRVIADHSRAAAFLIADGVVPGNLGRNYVCRMIIRRAARFGGKIGLAGPFMAMVVETVIENYGEAYPELIKNRKTILDNLTMEENQFQRTVESGIHNLESVLKEMAKKKEKTLDGKKAFELYATHGLPFEITRDIAKERELDVEEEGFREAMETHRIASGGGKALGELGGEDAEFYQNLLIELKKSGKTKKGGVNYDPYQSLETEGSVLALLKNGKQIKKVKKGDKVEIVLPSTIFYVAAGGQVSDTGTIVSVKDPRWEIRVDDTRQPVSGLVTHFGEVIKGSPKVGDQALATVDQQRRKDIMRNHTATHLLHSALHTVLGDHARQAGSLVAPDRLRFDFTHSEAINPGELTKIEVDVNRNILDNYLLNIEIKPLKQAKKEGAIALFGEKYGETVRTITMGDPEPFSYELCGGTHVVQTGDIGSFIIISEGSAAAGIRRIEALTGRAAYDLVQSRNEILKQITGLVGGKLEQAGEKVEGLVRDLKKTKGEMVKLKQNQIGQTFNKQLDNVDKVNGVPVMAVRLPEANIELLRQMADRFKQKHKSGVAVLAGVTNGKPQLISVVTEDLVKRGLHAGDLIKHVAKPLGGSGGGRAEMAQAGGKDIKELDSVLAGVSNWVKNNLKSK